MQPEPPSVPALAGADGEVLAASLEEEPGEIIVEAAETVASTWPLRSGPFFVCDGQLATVIAQAFAQPQIAGS